MADYELDYSEFITVNDDRQNIRVRAKRRGLPPVLFLHGGPGVCDRHNVIKYHSDLAEKYTVVCWDQRGSGKSYTPALKKSNVTVEDYIADTEFLLEYIAGKFGVEKVAVVGHSWGSILGLSVAIRRPDLVAVYVGEGQFIDGDRNEEYSHAFCLEEAKRRGDQKAVRELEKCTPKDGVYPSDKAMMKQRDYLNRYGGAVYKKHEGLVRSLLVPLLRSPEYNLKEISHYASGAMYLSRVLWDEVVGKRFGEVRRLEVPVAVTQGRHDYNTPSAIAKEWFDLLDAPYKKWVWFENSAHSPDVEEPEKWSATLDEIFTECGLK